MGWGRGLKGLKLSSPRARKPFALKNSLPRAPFKTRKLVINFGASEGDFPAGFYYPAWTCAETESASKCQVSSVKCQVEQHQRRQTQKSERTPTTGADAGAV